MSQLVQSLVRLTGTALPKGDRTYEVRFEVQLSQPVEFTERAEYADSGEFIGGEVGDEVIAKGQEHHLQVPKPIRDSLSLMAVGEGSPVAYQIEQASTIVEGVIERFTFPSDRYDRRAVEENLLHYFLEWKSS